MRSNSTEGDKVRSIIPSPLSSICNTICLSLSVPDVKIDVGVTSTSSKRIVFSSTSFPLVHTNE
ncbi:hypothetical protein D3C74_254250 [compost metagenome]